MIVDRNRFGDSEIKSCKQCGRRLHPKYNKDICPACMEMNLFNEVKDYIRKNDVNESQVADHFGISNAKVRAWIREGRIQYKNTDGKTVSQVYCQICGKAVRFREFMFRMSSFAGIGSCCKALWRRGRTDAFH